MAEAYNLDFDLELLSHLPDPDAWGVLRAEGFNTNLIFDEDVKAVYDWQHQFIRDNKKPATVSVLAEEFDLDFPDPETAIGDLIDKLRVRYVRSNSRRAFDDLKDVFLEDPSLLPKEMVFKGKELEAIVRRKGEEFGTGDAERAEQLYWEKTKRGKGASMGFDELDEHIYGQTGLSVVIGPPKTWKSWFMINAHIQNVVQGRITHLFSLELPAEETDMRMRCMISDIPWWKYLRDALTAADWKQIHEASEILDECGIYKTVKPPEGERSIEQLVGAAGDAGADCVFIDQLQYVEVGGKSLGAWNETAKFWEVLNRARDLSDQIPICFAHQFNREADNIDHMPSIKMAKSSAAVEETCTLAVGLWANKDMRQSSVCEMGVIMSRNYNHQSWEVGIELSRGCNLQVIGRVEE